MLINLSNHPSNNWPKTQSTAAIAAYRQIVDISFPQIPPEISGYELDLLVEKYEHIIRKARPNSVHIMGELTFTFRLVNRLKKIGFNCIASTTVRTVIEDGKGNKTSTFNFVQFREY